MSTTTPLPPVPLPVPPSVEADAKNRAWRTFAQGLGIDIAVALVVTVGPLLLSNDFAFTRAYWLLIGASLARTVIQTAVSYVARKLVPPSFK